tara:strand:+ start:48 stop:566 length:519 start_codon:yes stop_codon:yes gene_type:complete
MEGRINLGSNTLKQITLFDIKDKCLIKKGEHTQVCRTCNIEKPFRLFNTKGKFYDGYSYLARDCTKCDTQRKREGDERLEKYGYPPKDYCCPICNRDEDKIKNHLIKIDKDYNIIKRTFRFSVWAIDHDHVTKKFRGWLCSRCNTALGTLGDNITSLKKVLTYLKKAEKNNE